MYKNHKSQITLYIILGLVIFIAIGFVFYLKDVTVFGKNKIENEISQTPIEMLPIRTYIDYCIQEVAVPGIYLLASKGGYIYNYSHFLNTENHQIAYHLEYNEDVAPTKGFMEEELSRFIKDTLPLCVQNPDAFTYNDFEYGNITVKTTIAKENIIVLINYPIIKTDGKLTISDFYASFPIRLGSMLETKDNIIAHINNSEFIDLDYLASITSKITVLPYDKHNIVYSLYDSKSNITNSSLLFNFAIKVLGNSAPRLGFLPDFVLKNGHIFKYQIKALDPDGDKLRFYSYNALININETTGDLLFSPITPGEYETEICVEDTYLAKDCKTMNFMIKDE